VDAEPDTDTYDYTRAPGWRRGAATLVDVAVLGALWRLAERNNWLREARRMGRLVAVPGDLLREQVRSPGQRLLGLRTVDRRTGRRVALWRTLLIAGQGIAGQELARRLRPELGSAERERQREAFTTEMQAIMQRHPEASPEREAERRALFERYPPGGFGSPELLRAIGPALAVGLVNRRLRRHLAPTVEVLDRARGPHSP
jgi:hypothetical protein